MCHWPGKDLVLYKGFLISRNRKKKTSWTKEAESEKFGQDRRKYFVEEGTQVFTSKKKQMLATKEMDLSSPCSLAQAVKVWDRVIGGSRFNPNTDKYGKRETFYPFKIN